VASVKHLEPFLTQETSLAEAAQRLGVSKTRMSYWVKKMLELNLIMITRTEKRGKHLVRMYSVTAQTFIIPAQYIPERFDEDVFLQESMDKRIKTSLDHFRRRYAEGWQIQYSLKDGVAQLLFTPPDNSDTLTVTNYWGEVKLSAKEAKTFHKEIKSLFEKYLKAEDESGKNQLFKIILVEESPQ
jgi:DNA-binding transcriptional ArsR family regulator